jgi:hypothetical protein
VSKRISLCSELSFEVYYELDDETEPRRNQYTSGEYKPRYLKFTLSCASDDGLPALSDLKYRDVRLTGSKLKKDGTPGLTGSSEAFYSFDVLPAFVTDIISAAMAEVKAMR